MLAMGWLSDRIGRRPVLLGATAFAFVGALPLFWLMHHPDPALVLLGQLGFVLVGRHLRRHASPRSWSRPSPPAVRCTAIALGYNVTLGLVGGISPLVATWLVAPHRQRLQPGLHDHGGRGDFLPRHPELQGDVQDAAREGLVSRA